MSSRESFEGLEVWLNELDTYATKKHLIKMLVANKIDKVLYITVYAFACDLLVRTPSGPAVLSFVERLSSFRGDFL